MVSSRLEERRIESSEREGKSKIQTSSTRKMQVYIRHIGKWG